MLGEYFDEGAGEVQFKLVEVFFVLHRRGFVDIFFCKFNAFLSQIGSFCKIIIGYNVKMS